MCYPGYFLSLLGAAACDLLTQHNVAVCIVALQRATNKLRIRHAMQLNQVVLAQQNINARVASPAMECSNRLCVHSDGSFKREEETGYGTRGAVYMRLGRCRRTRNGGLPPAARGGQISQAGVPVELRLRAAGRLWRRRRTSS